MVGPYLLAAPVVEPGEVERRVYLPLGPEAWFDFHTGERHASGSVATVPAPLECLPLLARAGAIIPMTAGDTGRLHDEPSRHVLLFPGPGGGASAFALYEDDGQTEGGPRSTVRLELEWSPDRVLLRADSEGDYPLPYDRITVALPADDQRPLERQGALLTR